MNLPIDSKAAFVLVSVNFGLLFLASYRKYLFQYFWPVSFFFLGIGLSTHVQSKQDRGDVFQSKQEILFKVDKTKPSQKGLQVYGSVLQSKGENEKEWQRRNVNAYLFLSAPAEQLRKGDRLRLNTFLNYSENKYYAPWEFNFARYLKAKNVYYNTYVNGDDVRRLKSEKGYPISLTLSRWKENIKRALQEKLSPENASIICSVFLGDKSSMNESTMERFRKAGLMHIMAVSGMHVGIVFACIFAVFRRIENRFKIYNARYSKILAIVIIWTFIGICEFPPSAVRAGMMLSFIVLGKLFSPCVNTLNLLAASALIQILASPYIIMDLGFQFSYMAVLGIMFFYRPILKFICVLPMHRYLCQSIAISLSAQLTLAPLSMYYFGYFPFWFWLNAIPATVLASLALWGSMAFVLTMQFSEIISVWLAKGLNLVAELLQWCSSWSGEWLVQGVEYFPSVWTCLSMASVILLLWYLLYSNAKNLLTGPQVGLCFLPLIFFSFSAFNSSENKQIYFCSIDEGVSMIVIDGKQASYHFDMPGEEMIGEISRQLNVNFKETEQSSSGGLCINEDCFGLLSSGNIERLDYIILNLPVEDLEGMNLPTDKTYIISGKLMKYDAFQWEQLGREKHLEMRDARYQILEFEL